MKQPARYAVTFGLAGCYLPDYHAGAHECHTRAELANLIRDTLRLLDLPASLFDDVKIRRLWRFIATHGSSTAHFNLHHREHVLSFHGLTENEYHQANEE